MKIINIYVNNSFIEQLNELIVSNQALDINSEIVKNTDFYKEIQTAHALIATGLNPLLMYGDCAKGINLLIARIAATSPTLKIVDFSNSMNTSSIEIAIALAESHSIEGVIMIDNNFDFDPKYIFLALAKSTSICSIDAAPHDCLLGLIRPQFAEALSSIGLPSNVLHGLIAKQFAEALAKLPTSDILPFIPNPKTINGVITVFKEHNDYISASKEAHSALSDSLPDYLIDLVGEYLSNNHIEYEV